MWKLLLNPRLLKRAGSQGFFFSTANIQASVSFGVLTRGIKALKLLWNKTYCDKRCTNQTDLTFAEGSKGFHLTSTLNCLYSVNHLHKYHSINTNTRILRAPGITHEKLNKPQDRSRLKEKSVSDQCLYISVWIFLKRKLKKKMIFFPSGVQLKFKVCFSSKAVFIQFFVTVLHLLPCL